MSYIHTREDDSQFEATQLEATQQEFSHGPTQPESQQESQPPSDVWGRRVARRMPAHVTFVLIHATPQAHARLGRRGL